MDEGIAYCGLDCSACLAYKATAANDDELRRKTAEEWSKAYQIDIKPEDINCLGCRSDMTFGYCKTCQIRACNLDRECESCAICDDYGCDNIEDLLQHAPQARVNLDGIRSHLSPKGRE